MLCLCCSFLFTFFPHPSVGYFSLNADPHKSPKWVLPMAYRSSGTAPVWVFFTIFQRQTTPAWISHPGDVSWQKSAVYGLFSMGNSSYQEPSPGWALHGVIGSICLLLCAILHGLQGGYLLLLGSPCTAGQSLLWHLEHSSPPHPPPSSLTFVSAGLCAVPQILTPLSQMLQYFFTLSELRYHRGTIDTIDFFSFGQQWVCLGVNWNKLCPTWEQLLWSSQRNHLWSPSTTKHLPGKSNTVSSSLVSFRYYIWNSAILFSSA